MAAPLPAPSCIQVNLLMALGDDINVENRFHVQLSGAGPYSAAELNAWAQEVHDDFKGDVLPGLGSDLSLYGAKSRDISVINGGDGSYTPTSPTGGGAGALSMPANVALVGSWHEFISYRGGHPRTYLAGIPKPEQNTPQSITSTYQALMQTALANFLNGVNVGVPPGATFSGKLVCIHYRLNGTLQTPPLVQLITGVTVDQRIDSQRRRLA